MTARQEVALSPTISFDHIEGLARYAPTRVLAGRGDGLVDPARTNGTQTRHDLAETLPCMTGRPSECRAPRRQALLARMHTHRHPRPQQIYVAEGWCRSPASPAQISSCWPPALSRGSPSVPPREWSPMEIPPPELTEPQCRVGFRRTRRLFPLLAIATPERWPAREKHDRLCRPRQSTASRHFATLLSLCAPRYGRRPHAQRPGLSRAYSPPKARARATNSPAG